VTASDHEHGARAVENLIARYAELVDAGDFSALGEMFAHAVFGGEGDAVVRGREAVEGIFRATVQVYEDGTPCTKHVTTNIRIHVDDELGRAESHSYVTVFQARPELSLQPIVAGRYRDVFERHDGVWRFAERHFTTDLLGDVSRHLRVGPAILGR
jgi:3-phenylpropionate/cinnamic acid dioxygenase small subunit